MFPFVKKRIYLFLWEAESIEFIWMTSSLSCFCRAAKANLGWWERLQAYLKHLLCTGNCVIHIWSSLLLERDETLLTSVVLEVLGAAWHFDCVFWDEYVCVTAWGKTTHNRTWKWIILGDISPLTISHIICSVGQGEAICYFPGFHYVYVFI